MKKFWSDFQAFAVKGNMIDLAIGEKSLKDLVLPSNTALYLKMVSIS